MTMNAARTLQDDRGFTVTELVVSLSVFVVVMAVAGQLLFTATQANSVAITHTAYTERVTEPLDAMARNLMQATMLESGDAYAVTFIINPDLDETKQRVALDLSTPEGRIAIWQTDGRMLNTDTVIDAPLSRGLENAEAGIPAFRYYDTAGTEITDYEAVPSRAKTVEATIHLTVGGEPITKTEHIYLRNMFGY